MWQKRSEKEGAQLCVGFRLLGSDVTREYMVVTWREFGTQLSRKRGKGWRWKPSPRRKASSLLCARFQHSRSLGHLAPGCADPFSVWIYQTQRIHSLAALDHWRFQPTAMCLCRCGRPKHRGWVGINGDQSTLMARWSLRRLWPVLRRRDGAWPCTAAP